MMDTTTIKTTGRRVAADSASATATLLRRAGECSAKAAAGLADTLDGAASSWTPNGGSRTRRNIGIAVAVALVIAVVAVLLGRSRNKGREEAAGTKSATDLDEARQERSAS